MNLTLKSRLLAIINLAGFAGVIVMNVLANALPLNNKTTGQLSDEFPNLFVPAGITFTIWGLIYLLLAGFVAFQLLRVFRSGGENTFVQKTGLLFLISCLANMTWIVVWHYEMTLMSFFVMLILLGSLIAIYRRLRIGITLPDKSELLLVHLPFSIYLGWITIATIANATAVLVASFLYRFWRIEVYWATSVILAGTLVSLLMLFRRRDVFYTMVVIWAFGGIVFKRSGDPSQGSMIVLYFAGAAIVVLVAGILLLTFRKRTQDIEDPDQIYPETTIP